MTTSPPSRTGKLLVIIAVTVGGLVASIIAMVHSSSHMEVVEQRRAASWPDPDPEDAGAAGVADDPEDAAVVRGGADGVGPPATRSPTPARPATRPVIRESTRSAVRRRLTGGAPGAADAASSSPDAEAGEPEEPEEPAMVYSPDRDGIRTAVRDATPRIKECYAAWLKSEPDLQGRLAVTFVIRADGDDPDTARVAEVEIRDNEVQHGWLEGCVKNAMAELQFDPPDGELRVSYPFSFRPAE